MRRTIAIDAVVSPVFQHGTEGRGDLRATIAVGRSEDPLDLGQYDVPDMQALAVLHLVGGEAPRRHDVRRTVVDQDAQQDAGIKSGHFLRRSKRAGLRRRIVALISASDTLLRDGGRN